MVTKLHNQFGHPSYMYDKLSKFLTNAGVKDGQFFDILQEFSAKCDVCLEYKRKNTRPVLRNFIENKIRGTFRVPSV